VAVITGAGQAFSAGGDLDMVRRMAGHHDRVAHMLSEMSDLVYNMINCEKPIVSAISGVAAGSQLAIRWTKRSLNNWLKMAGPIFDQSAAYEMLCFMGPDVLEGAAALTEKRAPRFPSAG
jgi:enoyl-CoA hydratase/carnithine racemase